MPRTLSRTTRRVLALILLLTIVLPAGGFLFLMVRIHAYASASSPVIADAAVVLGNAVEDDGRPGPVLRERINHAVALYHAGRVRKLIFTGGVPGGAALAESKAARAYALEHGVREEDALIETVSKTTRENLQQAKRIMDQEGLGRVLVVSDPLHMRRAMTMAHDLGLEAHPSPTTTSWHRTTGSQLRFLCRETYYYAGYLIARTLGAR